jgi:hypothetical protein
MVAGMPQLNASSFRRFLGHPCLRRLSAYLGKAGANEAIRLMFPGIAC